MKYVKYFAIFILRLLIVLIAAGYIVVTYYGDEIKSRIIAELNSSLTIEIDVKKVDFSVAGFFENFPNVSIDFLNIVAKSNPSFNKKDFKLSADTLFAAKKLSLRFNVRDIWEKNYRITKIYAEDGKLQIFRDRKGYGNYDFWEDSSSDTESNIELKINNLRLKNINFTFIDKFNSQKIEALAKDVKLKGNFASESYSLSSTAEVFVRSLYADNINYVDHHLIKADVDMNVNSDLYRFNKGKLFIAGLQFDVKGDINNIEPVELNLEVKGNDIDIQSFLSLLPEEQSKYSADYESAGDFYFETSISGKVGNRNTPNFEARFGINNGEIHKKNSDLYLTNVDLEGTFTNGKKAKAETTKLYLKNIKAQLGNSSISGEYSMTNFSEPVISLKAETDFNLSELHNFIQLDTIDLLEGQIEGNVNFEGKVKNIQKFSASDFRNAQTNGTVRFRDVNLKVEKSEYKYEDVSGGFSFNNNNIKLDSLHFNILDNTFDIRANLKNFLSYVFIEDQSLTVEGDISTNTLNLENLLYPDGSSNEEGDTEIALPEKINLNLDIDIPELEYKKFKAKNIKGRLRYHDKKLVVNDLSLTTMGGSLKSDLDIHQLPSDKLLIRSSSKLANINIDELFSSFENFGQNFIMGKHLKGAVTSDIYFSSEWSSDLVPDTKELYVESNLEIKNGELVQFEPMLELSRFIEVDELKQIKFSTLKNSIIIQDQKINIPQMDIASSAFNLSISGIHSYENEFAYKIKVLLSDLLARKARRVKSENNEFGVVEDDGLGRTSLYLTIVGNVDDFKVSYDRKKVRDVIRENVREEKEEIKSILREEFGIFKRDSSIIRKNVEKRKEQLEKKKRPFQLNWDEDF